MGQVRLYRETGRGGRGEKRDWNHKNPRGTKSDERIVRRKWAGHPETRAGEATVQRSDGVEQRSCSYIYRRIRACLPGPETDKTHTPDDACQRVKERKAIAGGAVSYAPPPTPEPSTTSRTVRGGKPANGGTLGLTPAATKSVIRADGR